MLVKLGNNFTRHHLITHTNLDLLKTDFGSKLQVADILQRRKL